MRTPARRSPTSTRPRGPRRRALPTVLARLGRRPVVWWVATLLLAALTAQVVTGALGRAEAGAARYGSTTAVLVTTRFVEAGEVLGPDAAAVRDVPDGFVPRGAAGADALGRRVTEDLHEGEVVHAERVAPGGLSAVVALLPPGTRGIAVPTDAGALPLVVGDLVDVLATMADESSAAGGPPAATIAPGAVVVDVQEAAVTVAVPEDDAARVAYAVATGIVALALTPA